MITTKHSCAHSNTDGQQHTKSPDHRPGGRGSTMSGLRSRQRVGPPPPSTNPDDGRPTVLKVRVTPVLEAGVAGTTIELYADSYRYDPEELNTRAEQLDQQLVVTTVDGDERRFGLLAHHDHNGDWVKGHTIEIEPVSDPASDLDDTTAEERDQALQAAFEEIQAAENNAADDLRQLIADAATARGWTDRQLATHFNAWPGSRDTSLDQASFVVLADYLEHLQRTRAN